MNENEKAIENNEEEIEVCTGEVIETPGYSNGSDGKKNLAIGVGIGAAAMLGIWAFKTKIIPGFKAAGKAFKETVTEGAASKEVKSEEEPERVDGDEIKPDHSAKGSKRSK